MVLSLWSNRWVEVQLVMSGLFTNYVDDSGTDPNQRVAIASGFIVPGARITALENEWKRLTTKEGFTDFHTSEFAALHQNSDSQFKEWDDAKRKRVFSRVRQIAKKYGVRTISFAVKKIDYDEVVPDEFKRYWGRFHYTWALRQFVDYVHNWQRKLSAAPLEYVFDWEKPGDPVRKEIETVMQQAEDMTGNKGEFKHYTFRRRKELPGLQCADALAWTSYQYALKAFVKKPMTDDANAAWEDFRAHSDGDWRSALTVTRVNLEELVRKERDTGASLTRFRAWEARHKTA